MLVGKIPKKFFRLVSSYQEKVEKVVKLPKIESKCLVDTYLPMIRIQYCSAECSSTQKGLLFEEKVCRKCKEIEIMHDISKTWLAYMIMFIYFGTLQENFEKPATKFHE